MESLYNNFIGPFIFFSLIFLMLFTLILPKTKLSKYFKINETYFVITNFCGIICSVIGLIVIFLFPPEIVKSFLWKIIILPYVYLQIYTLYVMVSKKTMKIFDEKQEYNIGNSGGITMAVSIVIMGWIVTPLINNNMLEIKLLFPFYINSVLVTFSLVTLYLFKRA